MTTWLTKRRAALALIVPALGVVILATRTWVTGRSTDPVLGGARLAVTGNEAAPGLVALGLVALAAAVAVLTSGPRLRQVASGIALLAGLGATLLTVAVVRDPSGALGGRSGPAVGRTGPVDTSATLTVWPWPALLVAVVLTLAAALTLPAGRRWHGLSSRFDRPDAEVAERVARRSAWDDLSEGRDPTTADPAADPAADAAGDVGGPPRPDALPDPDSTSSRVSPDTGGEPGTRA